MVVTIGLSAQKYMQPDYYDELKTLNDDVDELISTVDKIPGFVVKTVKESEDKTNKNLKKLDDKISKIKNIEGKPGKDGKDGRDGKDGKDGEKGIPGNDGSPDTPLEIANKLNTLEGAIDASVIKNNGNAITTDHLNQILKAVSSINNVRTAMANASQQGIQSVVHDSSLSGLGTTASPLSVISVIASDVAVTVRAATTAALAGSPVYANGSSGVGATLTRGTNGVLAAQDGITLTAGDRLLVKNQSSTLQNGIYEVTSVGSASTKYVLTRTTDADETSELDELVVTASEGSTNRGVIYGQQTNNPTVGTSAITFATTTSTAVTQATTGTQVAGQIPYWNSTARQLSKGDSNFTRSSVDGTLYARAISSGIYSQITVGVGTLDIRASDGTDSSRILSGQTSAYISSTNSGVTSQLLANSSGASLVRDSASLLLGSGGLKYSWGSGGTQNYTFVDSRGTSGQFLKTNGDGTLAWATPSPTRLENIPQYTNDADATGNGLVSGDLYSTTSGGSTFLKIVP